MNTIFNVYSILDKYTKYNNLDDYMIVFGNREEGWNCNKEELPRLWSIAIRNSKTRYYGDVTLFYKEKLIRALHNAEKRLLWKGDFLCFYNVYNLEGKKRINSKKQIYE